MRWLADKALDGRIAMCAKEFRWDLEQSTELRRAVVLAMAQLFRLELTGPEFPQQSLDEPQACGRAALGQYYWNLETLRNSAQAQLSQLRRAGPNLSIALPAFASQHMANSSRALELWMCAIGMAINPKVELDVINSWVLLIKSAGQLDAAFDELVRIESLMGGMAGGSAPNFSQIDRRVWREACAYVPRHIGSQA